jgi:DNA-binding NarL/FixJ family response regulator
LEAESYSVIAGCWEREMSEDSRAKVFLLAQNRLLREVLSKILFKKSDLQVVGSCPLSADSLQEILAVAPDLLIVDSLTTNLALADVVRGVRQALPDLKLVLIGMDAEGAHFLQAIRQGAMGYLVKDASALEVVAAVRTVANGGAVCSPELCAFLFRFAARQNQMPNFHVRSQLGLTTREQQLVGLISRGLTNKEIAAELQLAEQTVRNHVHRMLRKLGATHRLAVVDICRMEGVSV